MPPSDHKPHLPAPPLVEVLDQQRRVLALMSLAEAVRQKLRHRAVALLPYDAEGRLHLRRRTKGSGSRKSGWDVPVRGHVLAGESVQQAVARELESGMGLRAERLRPVLELPPLPENGNEQLHVFTLTRTEPAAGRGMDRDADDYAFTPEELDCLLRDFRELVSPRFLQLAEALNLKGLLRRP